MTRDNVKTALQNEISARNDLYPQMTEEARDASSAIKKAFDQSMETDGEYVKQYEKAMSGRLSGEEVVYYVCQICGHVHENEIPEHCPICHAVPGRFKRVD
jgi:rubrerythrin